MRQTSEHARTKTPGGRRERPAARGRGGAAPLEAGRDEKPQPARVEKAQLERWENEGGAAGTATGPRKPH